MNVSDIMRPGCRKSASQLTHMVVRTFSEHWQDM